MMSVEEDLKRRNENICDCYGELCIGCGVMLPMHLGDFDTDRDEIAVVCGKCKSKYHLFLKGQRYIKWRYNEDDNKLRTMMIVALTDNAWNNREKNYPNAGSTKPIKSHFRQVIKMSRIDTAWTEEEFVAMTGCDYNFKIKCTASDPMAYPKVKCYCCEIYRRNYAKRERKR